MSNLEYLYVVEFANGTVKVGRTVKPEKRLSDHAAHGAAFQIPVTHTWVSEAHENSEDTELAVLTQLGASVHGREWFTDVAFVDVVKLCSSVIELKTDAELAHRRFVDAVNVVEIYTGKRIAYEIPKPTQPSEDFTPFFVFNKESFVHSSVAFQHYLQNGGELPQRRFIAALEDAGVKRKRFNDGSRLYGIAIRNLT